MVDQQGRSSGLSLTDASPLLPSSSVRETLVQEAIAPQAVGSRELSPDDQWPAFELGSPQEQHADAALQIASAQPHLQQTEATIPSSLPHTRVQPHCDVVVHAAQLSRQYFESLDIANWSFEQARATLMQFFLLPNGNFDSGQIRHALLYLYLTVSDFSHAPAVVQAAAPAESTAYQEASRRGSAHSELGRRSVTNSEGAPSSKRSAREIICPICKSPEGRATNVKFCSTCISGWLS